MKNFILLALAVLLLTACITSTQLHYQSDYREVDLNRTMDTGNVK